MNHEPVFYVSTVGELNDSHTLLYLGALSGRGHPVTAICPSKSGVAPAGIELRRLPVPEVNFWPGLDSRSLVRAIRARLAGWTEALRLVSQRGRGTLLVCEPDAVALAILCSITHGRPFVIDVREAYFDKALAFPVPLREPARTALKALYALGALLGRELIHVSKERQALYEFCPRRGRIVFCLPRAYLAPAAEPPLFFPGNCLELVHAGSLRWTYCGDEILSGIELLRGKGIAVRLTVIGGVAGAINREILERLIEAGWVRMIGTVPQGEVFAICQSCHLGINLVKPVDLGHYYAQPRKLYEYLALGLPVIGSDLPTIRRIVGDNHAGVCIGTTRTAEHFADVVAAFADGSLDFSSMRRNALRASRNHRWENVEEDFVTCFGTAPDQVL